MGSVQRLASFWGLGLAVVLYLLQFVLRLMTLLNTLYINIYCDSVLDLEGQVEMRWDQKGSCVAHDIIINLHIFALFASLDL